MKVNKLIASAVVTAILALESWTLTTVIDLKVQVAKLDARVAGFANVTPQADKLFPEASTLNASTP